jgi:hypothetical protein
MKKLKPLFVAFAFVPALVACTFDAAARQQARVSPHETVTATIDGDEITITYGRPYTKDPKSGEMRKIWGGLVKYGEPWRAGADEATTLTTKSDLMFGSTVVPAGSYTLYMMPDEKGTSKLAFGKKTGGWGVPVDTKNDLAQVDLKKEPLDKQVDQFTISLAPAAKGGAVKMMWEKTQYSTEFTVKK